MNNTPNNSYRADIDGLRAIAVLGVLIYHAFPRVLKGGFVGVDVFFVISGYLITSIITKDLEKGQFSILEFYKRRIRRIFPALSIVLMSVSILGWFFLFPTQLAELGKHIVSGAMFVANLAYWSESGYFDTAAQAKPLLHLWSLGIEEQFYIFWPLLLLFFWKQKQNLISLTVGLLAASFAYNLFTLNVNPTETFYSPLTRSWEMLIGAFIAVQVKPLPHFTPVLAKIKVRLSPNIASFIGLSLIVGSMLSDIKGLPYPGWLGVYPAIGTALLIGAGKNSFINNRLLALKPLVWIGLISYPLYLWHWPLLSISRIVHPDTNNTIICIVVLLSFLLSILTYLKVEKKIRHSQSSRTIRLLIIAILINVMVGLIFLLTKGLPDRFPKEIHGLTQIHIKDFKWDEQVRTGGCHISDDHVDSHQNSCVESDRPLVMIWGDSYAAALYPGLLAQQKKVPFGIAQMTSTSCPPLLGIEIPNYRKNCAKVNSNVLEMIKKTQPDVIIMHTTWNAEHYKAKQDMFIALLGKTISQVNMVSSKSKVVVLGPVPMWKKSLQECLIDHYMQYRTLPPTYMEDCLREGLADLDQQIQKHTLLHNAKYISALKQTCTQTGCLTRLSEDWKDLSSIDGGHISSNMAILLVERIWPELFQK